MLRSIDRLIVIAAPSCCGKSVFIAHLASGSIPQIAASIGVDDVPGWTISDAMFLARIPEEHLARLIVAYAIPVHEIVSGRFVDPSSDRRLDIVSRARETVFVTLLASSASLSSRLRQREHQNLMRIFLNPRHFFKARRHTERLKPIYRDPLKLQTAYDWWFQYVASTPSKNAWVINADEQFELRGVFKRMVSAPNRGTWVANAVARYELHNCGSWKEVLAKLNSDTLPS